MIYNLIRTDNCCKALNCVEALLSVEAVFVGQIVDQGGEQDFAVHFYVLSAGFREFGCENNCQAGNGFVGVFDPNFEDVDELVEAVDFDAVVGELHLFFDLLEGLFAVFPFLVVEGFELFVDLVADVDSGQLIEGVGV